MKSKQSSKTIWITKVLSKNDSLYNNLSSKGLNVLSYPLIKLVKSEEQKVSETINTINEYDWIIIPSPNAAAYLFESIKTSNILKIANLRPKVSCLGLKTSEKARLLGFTVDHISNKGNIQDLIDTIPIKTGNKIIYFTSDRVNQNLITNILKDKACSITKVELYKNKPNLLEEKQVENINKSIPDLIAIFSYSAIDALCLNAKRIKSNVYKTPIVCIGPRTADYARSKQFENVTYSSSVEDKYIIKACLDSL